MKTIDEILKDYTAGNEDLGATNAALKETGAGFHLEPGRNVLTEQDLRETTVGYYPEQADGWGLLDTGTGTLDKVRVTRGQLDSAVNEVQPGGEVNMRAYVLICGKRYEVFGSKLGEVRDRESDRPQQLPERPDLSRRTDLAGQTVEQRTRTGTFKVTYDDEGYAVRSGRREVR